MERQTMTTPLNGQAFQQPAVEQPLVAMPHGQTMMAMQQQLAQTLQMQQLMAATPNIAYLSGFLQQFVSPTAAVGQATLGFAQNEGQYFRDDFHFSFEEDT